MQEHSVVNRVIFALYICLITFAFTDVYVTDVIWQVAIVTLVVLIVTYLFSPYLFAAVAGIRLKPQPSHTAGRQATVCIITSIACMAVMMIWFIAHRPGSFQGDCLEQLRQALTDDYSDLHPVWHTLLFYKLPLTLTSGSLWSMTLFQMVYCSLAVGYMCMVIYRYAGMVYMIIAWAYVVLNPFSGQMMLYPWKDSAFAIVSLIGITMTADIIMRAYINTDDTTACTGSISRYIILGIVLANASIFRHNAILLTAPLMLALLIYTGWRRWIVIALAFMATMFVIKVPVYNAVNLQRSPQPVMQIVGLPLNIIGNVVVEDPDALDSELSDFVYSIASQEEWEKEYVLGNFGIMRYYYDINETPIEEAGVARVFAAGLKCLWYSPEPALKAFFSLTDIAYGPDIMDEGYIGAHIDDNDLGLVESGNPAVARILETYYKLVRLHGFNFLRQSAASLLIVLTVFLSKHRLNTLAGWKVSAIAVPMFIYAFGTMMLLVSPDSRFFYALYMMCPIMVMLGLAEDKK